MTFRTLALEALDVRRGYAALGAPFVEAARPTPLANPRIAAFSAAAAALLELAPGEESRAEFLALASGAAVFARVAPSAAAYGGRHTGSPLVDELGDGRVLTLAEIRTRGGDRWEWQLKGGGPTGLSRHSDGRATLRESLAEFLGCEALGALGVPTTRALAVTCGDERINRRHPGTAAVLSRLAPSMVRFGTFEALRARGDAAAVERLAGYVIDAFYRDQVAVRDREQYAQLLSLIVARSARLAARWEALCFAHGGLRTDNLSVVGITLDYGPFAFLDAYDPAFLPNPRDRFALYRFDRQRDAVAWGCGALADALAPLVSPGEARFALERFAREFAATYLEEMRAKLGLSTAEDGDEQLVRDLLALLAQARADYTDFFRSLCELGAPPESGAYAERILRERGAAGAAWSQRYRARLAEQAEAPGALRRRMLGVNPACVLRSAERDAALDAAEAGDLKPATQLLARLRTPFRDSTG